MVGHAGAHPSERVAGNQLAEDAEAPGLRGAQQPRRNVRWNRLDSNDLIPGCAIRAGEGLREVWPCGAM